MPYQFAKHRIDLSDYASGKVFYSLPNHPAFPIRLASEIFQRCLALRRAAGLEGLCRLYDPCCGAAYHLSALAFFHWEAIEQITGSDIDAQAVQQAGRNLGLLSPEGLARRIQEIEALLAQYGKTSHQEARQSALALRARLDELRQAHVIAVHVFQADATDAAALQAGLAGQTIDIVLTDIPYGQHSQWQQTAEAPPQSSGGLLDSMLTALSAVLSETSLVAVAADKGQKVSSTGYRRLAHWRHGKRQVAILRRETGSRGR